MEAYWAHRGVVPLHSGMTCYRWVCHDATGPLEGNRRTEALDWAVFQSRWLPLDKGPISPGEAALKITHLLDNKGITSTEDTAVFCSHPSACERVNTQCEGLGEQEDVNPWAYISESLTSGNNNTYWCSIGVKAQIRKGKTTHSYLMK